MTPTRTLFTALAAGIGLSVAAPGEAYIAQDSAEEMLPGSPVFERSGATPMIDFAGVQARLGGEPTEVLVLGTTHLSGLPEAAFDPADLSLILDRLEGFAPDIIAIEAVGGRTCDELRRYDAIYDGVADGYCRDPQLALDGLGMDQPAAAAAVETTLAGWPDAPSPAERRRFAALLYGAGEPWSAALQWAHLDTEDRIAEDGVSQALVDTLGAMQLSRNENALIAMDLALRLDIQTLAAMDDHSADFVYSRAPDSISDIIQQVWQTEHPLEAEYAALQQTFLASPESVREGYLFLNSEAYQRFTIEKDFGAVAAADADEGAARVYIAWWQARGLRMAANVIEAAGNDPGARVLVIVGASHKAYFDAYLDQMHDIELVSVEEVLGD